MIEVEKKAYLKDLSLLDKIKDFAQFKGNFVKEDVYFAQIGANNINVYKDPIFRIRIEEGKQMLSYKKKSLLDKTEVNQEFELDISHLDQSSLRSFFQYIGFYPFIEKIKKTSLYQYLDKNGFTVSLEHNYVDKLGDFLEIEILLEDSALSKKAQQSIADIFKKLSIPESDIESKYYIDLLMEKNL